MEKRQVLQNGERPEFQHSVSSSQVHTSAEKQMQVYSDLTRDSIYNLMMKRKKEQEEEEEEGKEQEEGE
jgi:hypothetical protein